MMIYRPWHLSNSRQWFPHDASQMNSDVGHESDCNELEGIRGIRRLE